MPPFSKPMYCAGVVHWLVNGGHDIFRKLSVFRQLTLVGGKYCFNEGCEVVGHLKEFKVCPQCKTARYCVSETGLDNGWAQGDVWHIRLCARRR